MSGILAPDAVIDAAPDVVALIERQALSWIEGRFAPAAADWHPDGVLTAPGGARVTVEAMQGAMDAFHRDFRDLAITVTSALAAPGGRLAALEWLWEATRRSDGLRTATPDAIVVELDGGRIRWWREYFDTAPTGGP